METGNGNPTAGGTGQLRYLILIAALVVGAGCGSNGSSEDGRTESATVASPPTEGSTTNGDMPSAQDLEGAIASFAEEHSGTDDLPCPLSGSDRYFESALPGVELSPSTARVEWMNDDNGNTFIACQSGEDMFDVVVGIMSPDTAAEIAAGFAGTDFRGGRLWVACDEPDICDAIWLLDDRVAFEAVYTFDESEYPDLGRDAAGWLKANLDQLIADTLALT